MKLGLNNILRLPNFVHMSKAFVQSILYALGRFCQKNDSYELKSNFLQNLEVFFPENCECKKKCWS